MPGWVCQALGRTCHSVSQCTCVQGNLRESVLIYHMGPGLKNAQTHKRTQSIWLYIKWLPQWDFFAQCQGSSIKWLAYIHLCNSALDSTQQNCRLIQANSHSLASTDSTRPAQVLDHSYPNPIICCGERHFLSSSHPETPAIMLSFSDSKWPKESPR